MISFFMKKFLILITFILLNTNVVSAAVKVGCGNIKFTEKATIDFHEYLTWKISRSDYTFSKPKNLGAMVINPKNKSYGKFLYLVQQSGSVDYVGGLYDSANVGLSGYKTVFSVDVYVFAKKNKIVWCKSKEKISRDITLEGLQNKLKELGLSDDELFEKGVMILVKTQLIPRCKKAWFNNKVNVLDKDVWENVNDTDNPLHKAYMASGNRCGYKLHDIRAISTIIKRYNLLD